MSCHEHDPAEALGCLDRTQPSPLDRRGHQTVVAHPLDRVGDRQAGDGTTARADGGDDRLDERGRDEGPRRVVHEDDVDVVGQDVEGAAYGLLPAGPAGDHDQADAPGQVARAGRRTLLGTASAGAATTTRSTDGAASERTACTSSGSPASRRSALGTPGPSRSPRPAAATTTDVVTCLTPARGAVRPGCPQSTGVEQTPSGRSPSSGRS